MDDVEECSPKREERLMSSCQNEMRFDFPKDS